MEIKVDTRYPYTYACDYLREASDVQISRANASRIRMLIAEAAGIRINCMAEWLSLLKAQESGLSIFRLKPM